MGALQRHKSYRASISLLRTKLIDSEIADESCKAKIDSVLTRHLSQYRMSVGQEEEYDEDFIFDIASMGKSLRQLSDEITLEELEEMEHKRNRKRSPWQKASSATIKVRAWHQKNTLKEMYRVSKLDPHMAWLTSFYRCDPRWQVMKYFDEVAREGGDVPSNEQSIHSPLSALFSKARCVLDVLFRMQVNFFSNLFIFQPKLSVFTVWRPTSDEAIRNMIMG